MQYLLTCKVSRYCLLALHDSNIERDGYSMIATKLPLFQIINALPIMLDPSRLDNGGGIEHTPRRNKAKVSKPT